MNSKYLSKSTLAVLITIIGLCAFVFGFGSVLSFKDFYIRLKNTCDFKYVVSTILTQEAIRRHDEVLLRENIKRVKGMHATIVIQPFDVNTTNVDWKWFLDIADIENVKVIVTFLPGTDNIPTWNEDGFNLGRVGSFIEQLGNHPALFGVGISNNPFNPSTPSSFLDANQLGILYNQVKSLMPNKYVYVDFADSLNKLSVTDLGKQRVCDICQIGNAPYTKDSSLNFDKDSVIAQTHARNVVKDSLKDVVLWSNVQTFGFGEDFSTQFPSDSALVSTLYTILSPELQSVYTTRGVVFSSWQPLYLSEGDVGAEFLGSPEHSTTIDILSDLYTEIISNCSI